ncbi:MAG: hypothetical protein K0R26_2034 [Bacteroidota bacterium]|jgi:hypothetical protein|nr:hypothetical protein [Bacteroidota bacterium]
MDTDILKKYSDLIYKVAEKNKDHVIAVLDKQLHYVLANENALKLLSKTQEEILGNKLLQAFPALASSKSYGHLLEALEGNEVNNARTRGTITNDGAIFESSYYPLKDHNKNVDGVICVTKIIYYPSL